MSRVSNFSAGPAGLPLPALQRAAEELLDFAGTGMSIMEQSHRGKAYDAVHHEAQSLIARLLGLGPQWKVLFVQGGATQQFAVVPMNLLQEGVSIDYVVHGHWGERALAEGRTVSALMGGSVRAVCEPAADATLRRRLPRPDELRVAPDAAFVHLTSNETIEGTQWAAWPDVGGKPLLVDMSSDFMWRQHDLSGVQLVYAGAQKNLGPSGVTIVLAHQDLLSRCRKGLPGIFSYPIVAQQESLLNTPPTFAIYLVRNVLAWIDSVGGLGQIEAWNREKAALLYGAIDAQPDYWRAPVDKAARSVMNVVWRLPSEALEEKFVKEAEKAGMAGLKGYRTVGGIRASLYNAVSVADVQKLVAFMDEFARTNRP